MKFLIKKLYKTTKYKKSSKRNVFHMQTYTKISVLFLHIFEKKKVLNQHSRQIATKNQLNHLHLFLFEKVLEMFMFFFLIFLVATTLLQGQIVYGLDVYLNGMCKMEIVL